MQKELRDKFKALRTKLEQAEQKLRLEQEKLKQEVPVIAETAVDTSADDRKLRELESKHHNLLAENNTLKNNLAIAEANVQNFVREMNGLLDTHDVRGLI